LDLKPRDNPYIFPDHLANAVRLLEQRYNKSITILSNSKEKGVSHLS
jgi:hypothetical protein